MKYLFWCTIVCCLLVLSQQSTGVELSADNYEEQVLASPEVWVVEYYSSRCGSCVQFEKTWDEVTSTLKKVKVGRVNIENKGGMELAERFGVLDSGIPNVRVVHGKSGQQKEIMNGEQVADAISLKNTLTGTIKETAKLENDVYVRVDL